MKYKLLLWDFDGTLADTLSIALAIYNRMASEKNFRAIEDPHAVRSMGMREFLKSHQIPAHQIPFAFRTFLKELRRLATEVRLNEGVAAVVTGIAALDIAQGVVSSNDTDTIRICLEHNGVADAFRYVSGTSRIFGKERRIRKAITQCGCAASDVLYVGDEVRDIEASRAAGLDVASVTWGLNNREALMACRPTYLVSHPDELLGILGS